MLTELLAFNQRFGDIDADKIVADLIDYKSDKSLLQAETGVRFTYCQQGLGADLHFLLLRAWAPCSGDKALGHALSSCSLGERTHGDASYSHGLINKYINT